MSKDEEKEGKRPCKELNKPQSKDMNESDITPASNNMRGKKTRMSKRLQMPERVNSFADSMKKNVHDKEKQEKVKQKLQAGLNVAKDIAIEEATNLVMKDPRVRAAKFVVGVAVEQIKKQKKK